MDRASQYLVFVASVLAAVQNGAVLEMTGEAAKIEFGGALTLSHNTSEDQLTCSGKIKATDVLIEGTSTTVADLIGEVATLKDQMAEVLSRPLLCRDEWRCDLYSNEGDLSLTECANHCRANFDAPVFAHWNTYGRINYGSNPTVRCRCSTSTQCSAFDEDFGYAMYSLNGTCLS